MIIFTLTLVYKPSICNETFAVSPSFVRQEITDAPADWKKIQLPQTNQVISTQDCYFTSVPYARNEAECKTPNGNLPPDINAVSFISDGQTLNSTIWLSDKFQEPPINTTLDSFRERLQIIVVNLTNQNITTPEFANITLQRLKNNPYADTPEINLHVIESRSATIWGYYPAYKIVYQYNTLLRHDNRVVMDVLTVKHECTC